MSGKDKVCAEIQRIMRVYHEQYPNVDTPGGLEHMGDVWSLFLKWDEMLSGPAPAGEPQIHLGYGGNVVDDDEPHDPTGCPACEPRKDSLMVERHDYRENTYAIGSDYRPQPQAPEEKS